MKVGSDNQTKSKVHSHSSTHMLQQLGTATDFNIIRDKHNLLCDQLSGVYPIISTAYYTDINTITSTIKNISSNISIVSGVYNLLQAEVEKLER